MTVGRIRTRTGRDLGVVTKALEYFQAESTHNLPGDMDMSNPSSVMNGLSDGAFLVAAARFTLSRCDASYSVGPTIAPESENFTT